MHLAIATLKSITPYSPSRNYTLEVPKLENESADAYDLRTWRNHAHKNERDHVIIPGVCFAHCIKDAAQKRGDRVPGKGTSTFTKCFDTIEVHGDLDTGVAFDKTRQITISCNPQGMRRGGKRVPRCFPMIDAWEGVVTFLVWDTVLTEKVFAKTLDDAGLLIGIGRYRPQNRGFNGRFTVTNLVWKEHADHAAIFAAQAAE